MFVNFGGFFMKRLFYILGLTIIMLVSGCSNDEPSPNDLVEKYIQLWNESSFTQMYEVLSKDTTETFSTEDFIDRYEKVYADLEIKDIEITYTILVNDTE